jgi:membrane protein YdbS with pleckstrin-like domain
MNILQIVLFWIGVVAFLAAIFFIGTENGDTLWRAGISVLLLDLVCIKLWPATAKHN